MTFLYDLLILSFTFVASPWLLYKSLERKDWREIFWQRWWSFAPKVTKNSADEVIWLHAVSVGEVLAAAPLIAKLKREKPSWQLIVSTVTKTGHETALKTFPDALTHLYLPFDLSWNQRRFMRYYQPKLVLICETDGWYQFLSEARKVGATCLLINGKISERTFRRMSYVPWIARALYGHYDTLCLQTEEHRNRLINLGIDPSKMVVTGNLKFEREMSLIDESRRREWYGRLKGGKKDPVIVIGSTHEPEEEMLLPAINCWLQAGYRVILVPRHPDRFSSVAQLLEEKKVAYSRWSDPEQPAQKLLLLDAMGLLTEAYQVASVSVVAGSFCSHVGGHNLIEPCYFAVPVFYGPYVFGQLEMDEIVQKSGAGEQVEVEQLGKAVCLLLEDLKALQTKKEQANLLMSSFTGSVQETLSHLL